MFYPLITALFGTIFASGYKIATLIKARRTVVTAVNLIVTAVIAGTLGAVGGWLSFNRTVVMIGGLSGITLYACIAAFFQVMRYGRLSVQWTIINMSIAVPAAVSIMFWGERPSMWAIMGFVLAAAAMTLIGIDKGTTGHVDDSGSAFNPNTDRRGKILWVILVLISYFGTGFTQVCNKALVHYEQGDNKLTYIFMMYSVASVLSLIQILIRRPSFRWRDAAIGSGMAVSGLICTLCLLTGLQHMEAVVFFPVRSIFAIMMTTALSVLLWKERIQKAGIIGLIIAGVAVYFLGKA